MSNKVVFGDGVAEALKEFHKGLGGKENCYMIIGYSDKNTLTVLTPATEGGLETAKAADSFPLKEERYCLIRIEHQVEVAKTTKFALVTWYPDGIRVMRKAMLSTHKGQVRDLFKPYHVALDATEESELDEAEIMDKIGFSSGTKVHTTTKEVYKAPMNISSQGGLKANYGKTAGGDTSMKNNADLKWLDEEAAKAAMAAVKSDSDDTNWLLLGYENPKTLKLLDQGSGGCDELASKLDDSQVFYGYFRVVETIAKSDSETIETTKFGTVKLMSSKVSPINRAKVATHAGFLQSFLYPAQVSLDLISKADFSAEIVMAKLGAYSGARTNVTAKTESVLTAKIQGL